MVISVFRSRAFIAEQAVRLFSRLKPRTNCMFTSPPKSFSGDTMHKIIKGVERRIRKIKNRVYAYRIFFIKKETQKPSECAVCGSANLRPSFIHTNWYKRCWECRRCGHISLYDADNNALNDHFSTNKPRADFYLEKLKVLPFDSVLEIGTPKDFYFLTALHNTRSEIRKISYDIFSKPTPGFVETVKDFEKASADLLYAIHVLEHIPDAREFVRKLPRICKKFIVEVPNCPEWYVRSVKRGYGKTAYHYHFFNAKSLGILFKGIHGVIEYRTSKVLNKKGDEHGSLIIHNTGLSLGNPIPSRGEVNFSYTNEVI